MRGSIEVSDPWEFATETGLAHLPGVVEALSTDEATLRLDATLMIGGHALTLARVTPRHIGHPFNSPCLGVPANIVFRSNEHQEWYAAIGTLTVE